MEFPQGLNSFSFVTIWWIKQIIIIIWYSAPFLLDHQFCRGFVILSQRCFLNRGVLRLEVKSNKSKFYIYIQQKTYSLVVTNPVDQSALRTLGWEHSSDNPVDQSTLRTLGWEHNSYTVYVLRCFIAQKRIAARLVFMHCWALKCIHYTLIIPLNMCRSVTSLIGWSVNQKR